MDGIEGRVECVEEVGDQTAAVEGDDSELCMSTQKKRQYAYSTASRGPYWTRLASW